MGDDQGGAPPHGLVQGALDQELVLGVQRAGRFIQQQDGRIPDQRPRYDQTLTLAAGEDPGAIPQAGFQTLGQGGNESLGLCGANGGGDLRLAGARVAKDEVVRGRAGEQRRILGHPGDAAANLFGIGVADTHPIDADVSPNRVVEAQKQSKDRGLTGAGMAYQRNALSGSDMKGETVQRRQVWPPRIGEHHVLEVDFAARRRGHRRWRHRRRDRGPRLEQLGDAFGGPHRLLHVAPHLGERARRSGRQDSKNGKLHQRAAAQLPSHHRVGAQPEHRRHTAKHQNDDPAGHDRSGAHPLERRVECRLDRSSELVGDRSLLAEGLDGIDRVQSLTGVDHRLGESFLRAGREAAYAAPVENERRQDKRRQRHDVERESGGDERQHHQRADERQQIAQGDRGA